MPALGDQLLIWWPLVDGTRRPFEATIAAFAPRRKRCFMLRFVDGDTRWSKLRRKKLKFDQLSAAPRAARSRPFYIGSTDPGYARAWIVRTMLLPALGAIALLLHLFKARTKVLEISRTLLFLVLFLIYPSTSASIFATFQCEELSDGTRWLRADLSIDCDSRTHTGFSVYAALMILVYPIGTPILYFLVLFPKRHVLRKAVSERTAAEVESVLYLDFLVSSYREGFWYFEVRAGAGAVRLGFHCALARRVSL